MTGFFASSFGARFLACSLLFDVLRVKFNLRRGLLHKRYPLKGNAVYKFALRQSDLNNLEMSDNQ